MAARLQARWLAYYLLKGTELRREMAPQAATARRKAANVRLSGLYALSNLDKST